jgi:hypothetical protein
MEIGDVVQKTFVLLPAEWSVARGLRLIGALGPTHIIVHRSETQPEYYYLYAVQEALRLMGGADEATSVRDALPIHEYTAAAQISSHARADEAPERCIIFDDDRLVGFYDAGARRGGVRRGGVGEAGAAPVVQPALVAEMPDRVGLHETVSLLVWLSVSPPENGPALALDLPAGSPVQVVVQARRGFAIVGRSECTLTVPDADETLPCQFSVRATEVGPGQVRVFAISDGQTLGVVPLSAVVTEVGAAEVALSSSRERVLDRVEVGRPDLSLLIWERTENGKTFLDLRLDAADPALGLNLKQFAPVRLRTDPLQYFRAFFHDIEQLPGGDARRQ